VVRGCIRVEEGEERGGRAAAWGQELVDVPHADPLGEALVWWVVEIVLCWVGLGCVCAEHKQACSNTYLGPVQALVVVVDLLQLPVSFNFVVG
jgi:hypothetical protein